ncbi:MAG: acyltransferase [Kineosporiaceae bacterium]|nr:acyltransferase [Kineosporiaceae bacterium]
MSSSGVLTTASPSRPPAVPDADGFRPEIQGLRALAVGLVVIFHLWPRRLGGGYIGVDVFFVISGYLITAHLFREVATTGTVRVIRFWARRIRRLLPAAFLVLAASALGTLLLAPQTLWAATVRQLAASALYLQNWVLQADAVDYMALDADPSPAQHYWSLSVEEQFYAVWPLLVILALWMARRRSSGGGGDGEDRGEPVSPAEIGRRRTAIAATLALVALASFTASVVMTARDAPVAYFSTFTRAWEFAAGALVALLVLRPGARLRTALGWLGLGAVVAAGVVYTERSPFPGWIAVVPVLGTVALIVAGAGGPFTAGWWLARRPARFIGDISYSVYLWHWPLIVLAPHLTGRTLRWPDKLVVLALTVVLAWLSKTLVEDPLRTRPLLAAAPRRAFAFALAGMLAFVALAAGVNALLDRRQAAAQRAADLNAARMAACLGPLSIDPTLTCDPVEGTGPLVVPVAEVADQGHSSILVSCQQSLASEALKTCVLGTGGTPRRTVALLGDSHAAQWTPLLDELGKQLGWRVIVHVKGSCPMSLARRVLPGETGDARQLACERFTAAALADLAGRPEITDVFLAAKPGAYEWDSMPGRPLRDPAVDGFGEAWRQLSDGGRRLHLIAGTPRTIGRNVPTCLLRNPNDVTACSVRRAEALSTDDQQQAAQALLRRAQGNGTADGSPPPASVIDLTDQLCDRTWCYARIGSLAVYRDANHVSIDYARLLAPYALAQLPAALRSP